tara:strand:+ start:476 stop:2164 length:1689 start_codon:yes stop_codon:yes gene_type:complete
MALTRVGGDLLKRPLNIGTGVTITVDGNATFSGIVTAANFVDAAGNPITGGGAGLGTAVVEGSTVGGEQIYYTDTTLTVTGDLTVNPPDSSNIAYTQYSEIAVEQGYDLIVEDGDDLIPDILGLSTETAGVLPGAGGRVRADQFTNKAGTGAPSFPNGISIGSTSSLGGDLTVTGNLTVNGSESILNTPKLEIRDINIGIASATNLLTDNQLNGAGFTIYGLNSNKSLTWDNPNDRMAFSTDLYAPRIYADSVTANDTVTASNSITVGDTFLKATNQVGLGTTSTTGRNAGVGTAIGTLIYNSTSDSVEVYGPRGWVTVRSTVLSVTGGTIDTSSRSGYTIHTFTGAGESFTVAGGPLTVEVLVVGGGGGGGTGATGVGAQPSGGAGGGGGVEYSSSKTVADGTYPITVGGASTRGGAGNPSIALDFTAGGGLAHFSKNGGASGAPQSNAGGSGSTYSGGGGGGAGGAGGNATGPITGGVGGSGYTSSITGTSVAYAGGGHGGDAPAASGSDGGGGSNNISSNPAGDGLANRGGGGGGGYGAPDTSTAGGSGIVIIAYQTPT